MQSIKELICAHQPAEADTKHKHSFYTYIHKYHFSQTVVLPQNYHPMELPTTRTLSSIKKLYPVQI